MQKNIINAYSNVQNDIYICLNQSAVEFIDISSQEADLSRRVIVYQLPLWKFGLLY